MYHSVAPSGPSGTAPYRVTPGSFEEQLAFLRDSGYYTIRLEDWRAAMEQKRPLPGRAVLITFDDGYLDFLTHAWPLLKRYGFSATVFLVTNEIGKSNAWDHVSGTQVPLLAWTHIHQLREHGVDFASHSASHCRLTELSPAEIVREGARSRAVLARELGTPPTAFAYPYGCVDSVVTHLIGASGYTFGLSSRSTHSGFNDCLLTLPRIEVAGTDTIKDFAVKVGPAFSTVSG
jgi:peptidoglycan/xylan/chitin deacetylase (PgdA/CDA1 family)